MSTDSLRPANQQNDNNQSEQQHRRRRVRRQSSILTFMNRMPATVPVHTQPSSSWWVLWLLAVSGGYLNELRRQKKLTTKPIIYQQDTTLSQELVRRMPSLEREMRPSLFFGTRSVLNSVIAYLKIGPRRDSRHQFREIMTMPQDGAQIAIDWELPQRSLDGTMDMEQRKEQILKGPIQATVVIILHGINNDASFGYIRSAMRACTDRGWAAAGMNMRGCGGEISFAPFRNTSARCTVLKVSWSTADTDKLFFRAFSLITGMELTTPRGYNGAYTGDIR